MEVWAGIEPANNGFADHCLTTWLPHHERVSGIEPPSHPWQGCIITGIRHPRFYIFYHILKVLYSAILSIILINVFIN